MNFPSSPTTGQEYTVGTRTWRYNGKGWQLVSAGVEIPEATTTESGLMSATDKTKLNAVGTMANRNATISTGDPSGGGDGDVWFKVE